MKLFHAAETRQILFSRRTDRFLAAHVEQYLCDFAVFDFDIDLSVSDRLSDSEAK